MIEYVRSGRVEVGDEVSVQLVKKDGEIIAMRNAVVTRVATEALGDGQGNFDDEIEFQSAD